jgi:hypothetical protein
VGAGTSHVREKMMQNKAFWVFLNTQNKAP